MKTTKLFAYMCIFALVSAGMSSCNKEDQQGRQNKEAVKTEFSIALPNQLSGKRHMPSATVQRDGLSQFNGIADGIILIPFAKTAAIVAGDERLGDNIILDGAVLPAELGTNSNAKVYTDVDIPLSTGSFLFYGKSAATGTAFEVGSLTPANLTNDDPDDISFALEQIVADDAVDALTASTNPGGKLLQYLTNVAIASDGQGTPKRWYEYTAGDDAAMKAMFDTYATMHGLSSFEVARVMTDLYKSLKPLDTPLATAIKDSISSATYATVDGSGNVTLVAALEDFPESYNLPVGSIDIVWDGTNHIFKVGPYSNMALPNRYVYPAQLWYFANSAIKTSNTSKQTAYDNVNDWDDILALHTDASAVNTKTRAVAITDPIQYAVARLDVQVKIAATSLADNSESVEGVATAVDCGTGLPVTAILVGGQQEAKFDFTANTSATEYTIYDNVMASSAEATPADMIAGTSYSALNHTLVLENGTADVKIAVEMENNTGVDFYGAAGQLIPKGGKFYVVGTLAAASATETGGHVFKQDYTTTARLNLKDLKAAYNTIPDLRTPQLELGFSVDLTWESGHTYTIDFDD